MKMMVIFYLCQGKNEDNCPINNATLKLTVFMHNIAISVTADTEKLMIINSHKL